MISNYEIISKHTTVWINVILFSKPCGQSLSTTPAVKREGGAGGGWWWIPVVTTVGTELVAEFGGASMPAGCRGGRGGGGPEEKKNNVLVYYPLDLLYAQTNLYGNLSEMFLRLLKQTNKQAINSYETIFTGRRLLTQMTDKSISIRNISPSHFFSVNQYLIPNPVFIFISRRSLKLYKTSSRKQVF